jgi:predicted unusual protein kinase regulating ubiquinone biosynthesis (AarF/ABC1/UbiB family)
LEELEPTYVKFDQALASRPDVIPPSLARDLSSLQDDMTSFDTDTARAIILAELNGGGNNKATVSSLVDSLSSYPVAAASVGQVYKLTLPGYGPMAVKVQ